jgi:hypothetical protein
MATYPVQTRRWTRAEYDRLVDVGIVQPGEPVELLGGELMVSEPQGSRHYTAVGLVEDALRVAFGAGWVIRVQGPIALDDESEPEPDVAAVPGTRRDYSGEHPAPASWSRSATRAWASTGIAVSPTPGPVYRLLDRQLERVLEIYREPVADPSAVYGWRYARGGCSPDASVNLLAVPTA